MRRKLLVSITAILVISSALFVSGCSATDPSTPPTDYNTTINTLKADLVKLEETTNGLASAIASIPNSTSDINSIKSTIASIQTSISSLNTKVNSMGSQDLTIVNNEIVSIKNQISVINDSIQYIKENPTSVTLLSATAIQSSNLLGITINSPSAEKVYFKFQYVLTQVYELEATSVNDALIYLSANPVTQLNMGTTGSVISYELAFVNSKWRVVSLTIYSPETTVEKGTTTKFANFVIVPVKTGYWIVDVVKSPSTPVSPGW